MKSKEKKTLNRCAVAMLSASMVIPSVLPVFPAFAEESARDSVRTITHATTSEASLASEDSTTSDASVSDAANEDFLIADGDILAQDTATPSVPKKASSYSKFGTTQFWNWFNALYTSATELEEEDDAYEEAMERFEAEIAKWYNTVAAKVKATGSDAQMDYPAFDDSYDLENSPFWSWFYSEAVTLDKDGNLISYKNSVILDWISHSSYEDVYQFLISLNTIRQATVMSAIGNLWPDNYGMKGDLYTKGRGTEESPYIIDSVDDLRTLAITIANDDYNEGTYYLIKKGTYDLNSSWIPIGFSRNDGGSAVAFCGHIAAEDGANIKNIGFKANTTLGITSEIARAIVSQEAVGFFGELGAGATVTNLYLSTSGNTLEGSSYAGILAGHAVDAAIKECTVTGTVKGRGYVGGIVGFAESSTTQAGDRSMVIEDCSADKAAVYTTEAIQNVNEFCNGHSCVGGIVGFAANTTIMDSFVSTNTGAGNHIYGNGSYVGGIVGVIENSDVYDAYVRDGEIGSSNAYGVGGIVGGYDGGQVKVGRFSGTVVRPTSTNNYSACFIGTRVNGAGFTYGTDGNIAYLFADTKAKADTGICGSRVEDDGIYDDSAHIGYWHADDNYYTLCSGSNVDISDDYFYVALENGVLNVKKTGENAETINHFTADKQGKPTRGYLLTINDPTVDGTRAAAISAYINGSYKPTVTSESLGSFAAGDVVYISLQDLADGTGYYQMIDKAQNPYYNYYEHDNFRVYKDTTTTKGVTKGAGYTITMPESDVTIGADYKKVSQAITTSPNKVVFELTQIRNGSRENPTIEWYATAYNGNKDINPSAQIITDADGRKWENIKLATIPANGTASYYDELFKLGSLSNGTTNDKFNLSWSTSNDGNSAIVSNPIAENGNVTDKKAHFTLNIKDSSLNEKVNELEEAQAAGSYKDSLTTNQPYWYHSIITATAQVEDSEDKTNPPKGYTDIDIKLNIKDNTNVSVSGVALSKNTVTYDVVRTLSGSRKNPTVTYTVNGEVPDSSDETVANLTAAFNPDYFSNDQVSWYLSEVKDGANFEDDKNVAISADKGKQDDGTLNVALTGSGDKSYYNSNVTLKGITSDSCDNSTISAIVRAQDDKYTKQMKTVPSTDSTYNKYVKVTAEDLNNNIVTDTCKVTMKFRTVDNTEIMPEAVKIDGKVSPDGVPAQGASNINGYNIAYTFAGNKNSEITSRKITIDNMENTEVRNGVGEKITATVTPELDNTQAQFQPYDKTVVWSLANTSGNTGLNPSDVLSIDPVTGQVMIRGFNDSVDAGNAGYSPWVQSLISEGRLEGVTVPVRIVAKSARDNSLVDYKDINITFTANTMSDNKEDAMNINLVFTKDTATSLAGTDIHESESWSGTDAQEISATATGTSEAPNFMAYKDGTVDTSILSLTDSRNRSVTTTKYVSAKTDAQWIQDIIKNRSEGNAGVQELVLKAKTTNGSSETEIPVTVNFRYDGTDMKASTIDELPDGYTASPDIITNDTVANTYDVKKASVQDRQIKLNVVATQGNYSVDNPGTRKWSYGIVKLNNTTYSKDGVKENTATYELSGDIKNYCKLDANGFLVPNKGYWEDVITSGQTKGSVSGIVTAVKELDGKRTTDSYKVTIDFRYDKAVMDSHEESFETVYTQDSQTNSVKAHWSGDNFIQLRAHIEDESGKDVTPKWESSDESIVTVDSDGRVYVNKETWMKDIIDGAQNYNTDLHGGVKTAVITAKHPVTGATADSCQITVNFRYDQAIVDKTAETYHLVLTQTSRTNNPLATWSGNEIRKINAKVFVESGLNNNPYWASEDTGIVTVDEAGNIEPVVEAEWQKKIVEAHKFSGQKKVAVHAANESSSIKDSCNVTVNFRYENVEMNENSKSMDLVLTASGNRSNPTYTITGNTAAVSAVLNSAWDGETKVVYASTDTSMVTVDQNGNIALVLPESMTGAAFTDNTSAFIKEAMKHTYTGSNPYISSAQAVITAASEDKRMADQCNLTLKMKYVDNTYSSGGGGGGGSSSGGGGGGGGGGGSSSKGVSPSGSTQSTATDLPSYVLKGGSWVQDARGNWLYSNGHTFTNEWAAVQNPYADTSKGQPQYDWFFFGADSAMITGWYTDPAGDTYFLHNKSDNTLGHMYTSWNWIDDNGDGIAECYYFEPSSNGFRGRLYKTTTTPDGYTVSEKGQWTENGIVITKNLVNQL